MPNVPQTRSRTRRRVPHQSKCRPARSFRASVRGPALHWWRFDTESSKKNQGVSLHSNPKTLSFLPKMRGLLIFLVLACAASARSAVRYRAPAPGDSRRAKSLRNEKRQDSKPAAVVGRGAATTGRRLQVPNGPGPQWLAAAYTGVCSQLNYFDSSQTMVYR